MSCEDHQLLEQAARRAVTRRNYVIAGCISGTWTDDSNKRVEPVLMFMLDYLREVFRNCVAKLAHYAEVSSVQNTYVALNDEHGVMFLDDKSKVQAFVQQRNPKSVYASTCGKKVERDICEDAVEYSLDGELLWQALNMNKNVFHDESLKQLLQSVEKMKERLGYLFDDSLSVGQYGSVLVRSLADGFIHLTEQYGPALKVVISLLNTIYQDDHMRCLRCTKRWAEETYCLATKCSGWEAMYTALTEMQSFPPEVKHLARVCLNDIHPNDFCVLLMSMGRSAIVEKWTDVLNAFASIKRTGNGGVNMVLLMLSLDLDLQRYPFYLQETTLVPNASGTYRALAEKWPCAASLKPQHIWTCARAYTDMMKNTCASVVTKLKEPPNGSMIYSTNTPTRKKINGKNLERATETFAAHLKNITGRSEYARVCLSDTGFESMVQLFTFVTSSAQSYYDLFIPETNRKKDVPLCSVVQQ